ncbi:MAG: hypothetical protein RQ728_06230 [Brevefilum sp.]|nr:hypothetical protein [Brevefilum sp.]MDW7755590.1 hypothetical protein [Brevefilum sp.]
MGYVNISQLSQFIPPTDFIKIGTGTWSSKLTSNVLSLERAAAAADIQIYVPISLMSSPIKTQGAKILSLDLWFKIAAADVDMLSPACFKTTLSANGSPVTAVVYSDISADAAHSVPLSAGSIGDHKMSLTFTNPPYFLEDTIYSFGFAINGTNLAVISLFGAQVSYKLRI